MPTCSRPAASTEWAVFCSHRPRVFMPSTNKGCPRSLHFEKKTHIRLTPRPATDGRNFLPKNYAATTGRTIVLRLASCASTTSMGPSEPTKAAKKRPRRPYHAKSLWLGTEEKSTSGETVSRHDHLCISMTVSKDSYG